MSFGITTVSGSTIPSNFISGNPAGAGIFATAFNSATIVSDVYATGAFSVGGGTIYPSTVAITVNDTAATLGGASLIAFAGTSDSITAAGSTPYTALLGAGSVLTEGAGPSTVYAGAGAATVTAGSGSTTVNGSSGSLSFSAGGSSGDSITAGSGSTTITAGPGGNNTLVGGSFGTTIVLTGASTGDLVASGTGVTLVNAVSTTGALTIATNPLGNSGTLVATLGSGADTVLGGGGTSVIQTGTGADVFGFIKGAAGGAETILGLGGNPAASLVFAGYGYTATDLPAEQMGSLGDVITLSDGTKITLAGIDHKIF
jgi:hypothetical protein